MIIFELYKKEFEISHTLKRRKDQLEQDLPY